MELHEKQPATPVGHGREKASRLWSGERSFAEFPTSLLFLFVTGALVQLNPADDTVVVAGDEIIVIAEDDDLYRPKRTPGLTNTMDLPQWEEPAPKTERVRSFP